MTVERIDYQAGSVKGKGALVWNEKVSGKRPLLLVMPNWLATLIVGTILGIAGMMLLSKGRAQFTVPTPNKTIENVKENVQWMKDQTR